jgi:hypothetical protein
LAILLASLAAGSAGFIWLKLLGQPVAGSKLPFTRKATPGRRPEARATSRTGRFARRGRTRPDALWRQSAPACRLGSARTHSLRTQP